MALTNEEMIAKWVEARLVRRRDRKGPVPDDVQTWVDWLAGLTDAQLPLAPASPNVIDWISYSIEDPDWETE